MTVKQAIFHLEDLLEDAAMEISPPERQAINLALILLKTRTPQEEALIDHIMTLKP